MSTSRSLLFFICVFISIQSIQAQTWQYTAPNAYYIGGNVCIGTTNPRGLFDVGANGNIYLSSSPNTGTAQALFLPGHIYIAPYDGSNVSYLQARRLDNSGSTSLRIRTYYNGNLMEAMHIDPFGYVGLATTSPAERLDINGNMKASGYVLIGTTSLPAVDAKLAVDGSIYSRKVKVTQSGWADYVFHATYRLRPLSEVEQYIQQYHHLPEVPSAAEVERDGLDLGDNQATLLKKIEELTLYVIEQNKKLEQQQQEIEALKKLIQNGK